MSSELVTRHLFPLTNDLPFIILAVTMKKREPDYYMDLSLPRGTTLIGVSLCNPWHGRHKDESQSTSTGRRPFKGRAAFSHRDGQTKHWKAYLFALGKNQYLGSFVNIIEAAEAHDNAAFYLNLCYLGDDAAYHSRSQHKLNWPEDYASKDPGAHPPMNEKTRKLVEDYRFAAPFRQTKKRGHRRVIQIWQTSATVRTELDRLTTALARVRAAEDLPEALRWAAEAEYSVKVLKCVGSKKAETFSPPQPPASEPIAPSSLPVTDSQQPVTSTEPSPTAPLLNEPANPRDIIIT